MSIKCALQQFGKVSVLCMNEMILKTTGETTQKFLFGDFERNLFQLAKNFAVF